MLSRRNFCLGLAAVLPPLLWARPSWGAVAKRSILLVWDTSVDSQMETYLQLVQHLKSRRTAGHFESVTDLDHSFKVYDFNEKSHAQSLAILSLNKEKNSPYLSVVSLSADGLPSKVLWGVKVADADAAITALDVYLGLTPTEGNTPPATTAHWIQADGRWAHESGISLAIPASFTTRTENGALKIEDAKGGLALSFYPATDQDHRNEALALFVQSLQTHYPHLQLTRSRRVTKDGLVFVSQSSRPGSLKDGRVVLGSVGNHKKSLVYSGLLHAGATQSEAGRVFQAILHSIEFH